MGKKKLRTGTTSKGLRPSVSKSTLNAVRNATPLVDKYLNKIIAWRAGKNPWIVVENKSKGTNTPFIKVRANELYGDPKYINREKESK